MIKFKHLFTISLLRSVNPPYRYPSSSQCKDEDKSELSVIDNLMKHLPWPLSMVGRLGEQQREETERYPDSIQSILSVVYPEEDSEYSRTTL